LQLGAELQGEEVRARILHAEPLDVAAAKTQMGLRIFLRDSKPLESIAKRLEQPGAMKSAPKAWDAPVAKAGFDKAAGEVTLVMLLDLDTEAEIRLPGRFRVSPQIAGAIKAVPGVVDVQTV
jgi:DNA polymerase-3 subunit alpha